MFLVLFTQQLQNHAIWSAPSILASKAAFVPRKCLHLAMYTPAPCDTKVSLDLATNNNLIKRLDLAANNNTLQPAQSGVMWQHILREANSTVA